MNPVVAQIISAPNFDHFLTLEVRSAYLALSADKTINPNEARRYVYGELIKLVNHGWLRKSVSKKKEITRFVKTDLFVPIEIEALTNADDFKKADKNEDDNHDTKLIDELFMRLNNYKTDLLAGLGEVDEYKLLCEQFPYLRKELQPKYNKVREANSKLLGSIKAIESVLSKLV
ncbi:hypothetical protein [Shewanella sp. 10N.286.48.A6]|uniref:hypothetical protein n=1 Tax=Shewanella sp. 10N.286.48.A6 TaxID=1880833 RepID=UPI00105498AF